MNELAAAITPHIIKRGNKMNGDRRFGNPRTDKERRERHNKLYDNKDIPKRGTGLTEWRARQKPSAIMKPSTFESITRSAAARGARNPKAVAGAAYWQAAEKAYKKAREK